MTQKQNIWPGILRSAGVIFLLCCVVWLIGRGRSRMINHPDPITSKGVLKIATDYTPDNFIVEDSGSFGGRQVELAMLLFPDTTLSWSFAKGRAEVIRDLEDGVIDLYAASIPLSSAESLGTVLVTNPLYTSAYALLTAADADWMADFTGDREVALYLSAQDGAAQVVAENIRELAYPMVVPTQLQDSPMNLALRAARRELKYVIVDRALAETVNSISPHTQLVQGLFFETNQVWLLSPHSSMCLDTINNRIQQLRDTEAWQHIIEQTKRN